MTDLVFSIPIMNSTITEVLREVSKSSGYDDLAVLALLACGGISYLSKGKLWDKPDPYHHLWFERPQERYLEGRQVKKETRNVAQKLEEAVRANITTRYKYAQTTDNTVEP